MVTKSNWVERLRSLYDPGYGRILSEEAFGLRDWLNGLLSPATFFEDAATFAVM